MPTLHYVKKHWNLTQSDTVDFRKGIGNYMQKTTRQGKNIECNNPETNEEYNRTLCKVGQRREKEM